MDAGDGESGSGSDSDDSASDGESEDQIKKQKTIQIACQSFRALVAHCVKG